MIKDDLISTIKSNDFETLALHIFRDQAQNNKVYNTYLNLLGCDIQLIDHIEQIPFLPIRFYKSKVIKTNEWEEEKIFRSSTTTSSTPAKHYIKDLSLYESLCAFSFESSLKRDARDYTWIALLPSYLERDDASLVHMCKYFMEQSKLQNQHYFYLDDFEALHAILMHKKEQQKPVILIGVTFALLDFAEQYSGKFPNVTIIETGGMKGRGEEPIRQEIHHTLKTQLQPKAIGSEYGMTELMSQSYLLDDEYFTPSSALKVLPRDITDPLSIGEYNRTACLNIIDLGNMHTCSFIATDDIGKVRKDGKFQVLGRLDYADVRGCSLMYT